MVRMYPKTAPGYTRGTFQKAPGKRGGAPKRHLVASHLGQRTYSGAASPTSTPSLGAGVAFPFLPREEGGNVAFIRRTAQNSKPEKHRGSRMSRNPAYDKVMKARRHKIAFTENRRSTGEAV
jgi:hypothetical protein